MGRAGEHYADAAGNILLRLGQLQGEKSTNLGNAIGGSLASLGQMIGQEPQRQLQQQELQARVADAQSLGQERQLKAQQYQDAQKGQTLLTQALNDPANIDPATGKIDHAKVADIVAKGGAPTFANNYVAMTAKTATDLDSLAERDQKHRDAGLDTLDAVIQKASNPDEFDSGVALATKLGAPIDGALADQLSQQVRSGGPDALKALQTKIHALSPSGKAEAAAARSEAHKITVVPQGAGVLEGTTPIVKGGPKPITNEMEAAIQAVAKDPQNPTPDELNQALDRVKPPKDAAAIKSGTLEDYIQKKYGDNATPAQILAGRQAYEATSKSQPVDSLTKVEHKDPTTGKTVIDFIPKSQLAGRTFEKGSSATVENRLASAQAVQQTGDDIIAQLSDPKVAAQLGPALGRVNTVRDFIGNPPPALSELAGSIESYSLANMGVHGMRSAQGAEMIRRLLDQKHTPASLIATIRGLQKFSSHFMENEGMKPTTSTVPQPTGRYNPATGKVEPIQ